MRAIPVQSVQHDVVERLLAGQHRREQDPVVVRMRLRAEHGHVTVVGRKSEELFERAHAGHAIADDDQLHSSSPRR
jgi:hypothetical protein